MTPGGAANNGNTGAMSGKTLMDIIRAVMKDQRTAAHRSMACPMTPVDAVEFMKEFTHVLASKDVHEPACSGECNCNCEPWLVRFSQSGQLSDHWQFRTIRSEHERGIPSPARRVLHVGAVDARHDAKHEDREASSTWHREIGRPHDL
jgi:hypothetical protein